MTRCPDCGLVLKTKSEKCASFGHIFQPWKDMDPTALFGKNSKYFYIFCVLFFFVAAGLSRNDSAPQVLLLMPLFLAAVPFAYSIWLNSQRKVEKSESEVCSGFLVRAKEMEGGKLRWPHLCVGCCAPSPQKVTYAKWEVHSGSGTGLHIHSSTNWEVPINAPDLCQCTE